MSANLKTTLGPKLAKTEMELEVENGGKTISSSSSAWTKKEVKQRTLTGVLDPGKSVFVWQLLSGFEGTMGSDALLSGSILYMTDTPRPRGRRLDLLCLSA